MALVRGKTVKLLLYNEQDSPGSAGLLERD